MVSVLLSVDDYAPPLIFHYVNPMEATQFDVINKWLRATCREGSNNQPFFRLVHSADQVEKRKGEFSDYTPSGLLLRRVTEVREVSKYHYLQSPCYVLERWQCHDSKGSELVDLTGSYEPVWAFLTSGGKAIDPVLRAVQFIIHRIFNPKLMTPSQLADLEEEELSSESSQFADMLDIGDRVPQSGYTKEIISV